MSSGCSAACSSGVSFLVNGSSPTAAKPDAFCEFVRAAFCDAEWPEVGRCHRGGGSGGTRVSTVQGGLGRGGGGGGGGWSNMVMSVGGLYRSSKDEVLPLGRGQTVARVQHHRSDKQHHCQEPEPSFRSHGMARDMRWRACQAIIRYFAQCTQSS